MLKYIRFIIIFQLGFSSIAVAQDTISLNWCIDKAHINHPRFGNTSIIESISENKLENIHSGNLPQLELNGKASYQSDAISIDLPIPGIDFPSSPKDQYKVSLDITQSIYDGGFSKSKGKIEDASKNVEISQLEIDLRTSKMQIKDLYFSILNLQKNLEIIDVSLNQLQENRIVVETGINNGVLLDSDRDLLDVEIIKLKQRKSELLNAKRTGIEVLSFKMGEAIDPSVTFLPTDFYIPQLDSIERMEEKLLDQQAEVLEMNKSLLKARTMPKLYAFGQFAYGNPGLNMLKDEFDTYYIVGAGLKWTIWDWNTTNRDKEALTYQQNLINSRKLQFESDIHSALVNQKSTIKNHEENLLAFENILNLRSNITKTAKVQLQQGVMKTLDYLTIFNQETMSRIQLENEKLLLQQAIAKYLEITGEL